MAEEKKKAAIQGSGKKGGTVFPRISLVDAMPLAIKLVSKTHVSPQSADIILPGVFGSKGPPGQIKASALKQYGLLEGKSDAYTATKLAKNISATPPQEQQPLYAQACLAPKVFRILYQTFHGDTVSMAKLKQQAAASGVHPDFLEDCAILFAKSAEFAGLGKQTGDSIQLVVMGSTPETKNEIADNTDTEGEDGEIGVPAAEAPSVTDKVKSQEPLNPKNEMNSSPMRAVINVNVTLDSSLDTEKLERQLALLRKYGAL